MQRVELAWRSSLAYRCHRCGDESYKARLDGGANHSIDHPALGAVGRVSGGRLETERFGRGKKKIAAISRSTTGDNAIDSAAIVADWSPRLLLVWIVALLAAFALRAAPIVSAKPYIAYIDEGNLLHPVVKLLRLGGW